jgi:hypothetical protein
MGIRHLLVLVQEPDKGGRPSEWVGAVFKQDCCSIRDRTACQIKSITGDGPSQIDSSEMSCEEIAHGQIAMLKLVQQGMVGNEPGHGRK